MPDLSTEQRDLLLAMARGAIHRHIEPATDISGIEERIRGDSALADRFGLFVTLKTEGADGLILRGCVGCMHGEQPLGDAVAETACRAAFEDPRFPPVRAEEISRLRISISLLSPLSPVEDPGQIKIGRDGVQLESGARRAVFLPQVAVEQNWDIHRLLEQLSLKAGLPASGWSTGALSVFQTEVFGETQDFGANTRKY